MAARSNLQEGTLAAMNDYATALVVDILTTLRHFRIFSSGCP